MPDAEPLTSGKEAYSYSPGFSTSKEFKFTEHGRYKYSVVLATKKSSPEFPKELIASGKTRKAVRNYYTLEEVFDIE